MRVIAGEYRSRPLRSLRGMDLRPTADRLRETLFDVLTAGNPSGVEGSIWLDLYAGTGAVGIEALSRGAAMVYFVECSGKSAELVRNNLRSLGVAAGYQVLKQETARALRALDSSGMVADFIFLDPPYRMEDQYQSTLEFLGQSGLLRAETLVIAEHQKRLDPSASFGGLQRFRRLDQGDASLSFYRLHLPSDTKAKLT